MNFLYDHNKPPEIHRRKKPISQRTQPKNPKKRIFSDFFQSEDTQTGESIDLSPITALGHA
jgi:hypothetical protein